MTLADIAVPSLPVWALVLRASVVYIAVILLVRAGGKRQIGKQRKPQHHPQERFGR